MNTDDKHNELLLDIIIPTIEGYIWEKNNSVNLSDENVVDKGKFSYLLGQSIRHWIIPDENWHTSRAALEVWKKISGNNLMPHFRYKESFKSIRCITIPRFKGSNRDYGKIESFYIDTAR